MRAKAIKALHRFCFIVCELSWLLEKSSEVVSLCLPHSLEFKTFLLLNCLPPKMREAFYLPYSWGEKRWIYVFPMGNSVKVNAAYHA